MMSADLPIKKKMSADLPIKKKMSTDSAVPVSKVKSLEAIFFIRQLNIFFFWLNMDLLPRLQHISSLSGLFYFNSLYFEYYFDRVCTDRSWDNCTVWSYVSPQMHVRVAGEKWKMPSLCKGNIFLCALLLYATQFPLHSTWYVCSLLKMHCQSQTICMKPHFKVVCPLGLRVGEVHYNESMSFESYNLLIWGKIM